MERVALIQKVGLLDMPAAEKRQRENHVEWRRLRWLFGRLTPEQQCDGLRELEARFWPPLTDSKGTWKVPNFGDHETHELDHLPSGWYLQGPLDDDTVMTEAAPIDWRVENAFDVAAKMLQGLSLN